MWPRCGPDVAPRWQVRELRRWHPDKFTARWGGSLAPSDAAAVLDGVKRVSQALNELLSSKAVRRK